MIARVVLAPWIGSGTPLPGPHDCVFSRLPVLHYGWGSSPWSLIRVWWADCAPTMGGIAATLVVTLYVQGRISRKNAATSEWGFLSLAQQIAAVTESLSNDIELAQAFAVG